MSDHLRSHSSDELRFLQRWSVAAWQETRMVIACSGGPDSTALVRLLHAVHPRPEYLIVAHFHHGLRAATADGDAEFVRQLTRSLGLTYAGGSAAAVYHELTRGEGWESAARQLRYSFLRRTAKQHGARYLATGHTADDQVETVLHHLIRGSSWAGLAGIPVMRVIDESLTLVRPLLGWSRAELLSYLAQLGQSWRHDEHNDTDQFTRNRIRQELLPLLEARYHPGARGAVARLGQLAAETQEYFQTRAARWLDQAMRTLTPTEVELETRILEEAHPLERREVFVELWRRQAWPAQAMTAAHWQLLSDTCMSVPEDQTAPAAKLVSFHLPGPIHISRSDHWLRLIWQAPPA